jgi:hypothetical protein
MSYDPKVYELVKHFLETVPEKNTKRNRQLLAQHLQDELEDWILFMLLPGDKEEA